MRLAGAQLRRGGRSIGASLRLCLLITLVSSLAAAQSFPGLPAASSAADSARVLVSSGRVSVARSGELWVLNPGDLVKPSQEIVTGVDGYAVFELSDGSRFEVFPNSHVLFRSNRGNWSDVLDIWVGRLKVHIEKIMGKPNPNRIHTPTAVISVRGTTFLVEVDEDSESTTVSVEEGAVVVEHRLLPNGKQRVLGPGDELRVDKDEPIARARIDRGGLLKASFRALSDALYTIAVNASRTGGGASTIPGGGGSPLPGDKDPSSPPPPPPSGGGSTVPSTGGAPPPPPPPPPPGI
ncbi:MAG: FecR domain-containing protein [Bryobacterales bacterium]|nr:FecR domain-containing protein [Bryobacterales bacterium]